MNKVLILLLNANDCATNAKIAFCEFLKKSGKLTDEEIEARLKKDRQFFIPRRIADFESFVTESLEKFPKDSIMICSFPNEAIPKTSDAKRILKNAGLPIHLLFRTTDIVRSRGKHPHIGDLTVDKDMQVRDIKPFEDKGIEVVCHKYKDGMLPKEIWADFFSKNLDFAKDSPQKQRSRITPVTA